jgi:hypothetical protein
MMASLYDALFGCWHTNRSFPITMKAARHRYVAASVTGMYVVCLDCGREFPYDWTSMKVVSRLSKTSPVIDEPAKVYATN